MLIGIDASRAIAGQRTGTETYSLNLIRALIGLESEHRFRLYTNRPSTPDATPPPMKMSLRGASFATKQSPLLQEIASAQTTGLAMTSQGPNVELRAIPLPRLWTHIRLSAEMLTRPPDLLFVPSHVLPLIHPRRSVVTVHDLGYLWYPQAHRPADRRYLDWSTRWNAQQATAVLADSQATKDDLTRAYGINPAKVHVIYLGRDETLGPVHDADILAAVRERYGIAGRYLLYVGTLQPRKNLARLIEAFGRLAGDPALADIQLVLAGKRGWLYDDLFAQVNRAGLTDRVIFPGYVADADLPALLSGTVAFVFPSLYEGFGIPVLEAGACGVPVITSNTSSLPEVAGDPSAGSGQAAALLVDPHDVDAIADAMYRLVTDADLRAELTRRGQENIKRFSWEKCARETLAVLEAVGRGDKVTETNRRSAIGNRQSAIRILGIRVDALTYAGLLERIAAFIASGAPHQIATLNPEFVMEAQRNEQFRAVLEQADLCLADGVGLLWAARRQGRVLPERVTGSDALPLIAERAARDGWRLYLLGAAPGVAEQTGRLLQARYPGIIIAGAYAGSPAVAEAPGIVSRIRATRPDVLFVAYGAPKQDLWIAEHRDALGVPAMIGVGGAFDHLIGVRKRAPAWVQRLNLEWLFRLITQPWRWRRQLALPRFVWAVYRERVTG